MGGPFLFAFMVVTTLVAILGYVQINNYFALWGDAYFEEKDVKTSQSLVIPNITWAFMAISIAFFRTASFYLGGVSLGRKIHSKMTFRLLHANINNFLKRTPFGRILNRFSNDINNVDIKLSFGFEKVSLLGVVTVATVLNVVLGADNVLMLVPLTAFSAISFYTKKKFMKASMELYRLDAITKSPVIGISNSCIGGGAIVRSMRKEKYFAERFERDVNENTKNAINIKGAYGWFQSINFQLNFFVVLMPCYIMFLLQLRSSYDPGSSGEANKHYIFLGSIVNFAGQLSIMLLLQSTLENYLISVERCRSYEKIEIENGYKTFQQDEQNFEPPKESSLSLLYREINQEKEIFKTGNIELTNVSASYPTATRPIINNVSLKAESGQKIGIVGRTGAGKSSFIKLFWRALEPSEGVVKIDGKDISKLNIKSFRKEINIITQKPNLFQGTILSNITHQKLSRDQINVIRDRLLDLGFSPSKLEDENLGFEVTVSGENLSQSEKQIVCLMHALQHSHAKLVIMDEATAYIDERVEREFQKVVWDEFKDSTVFIIAHRISNVVNCDRILVFDQGRLIEDGDPQDLLKDKESVFYELWSQS